MSLSREEWRWYIVTDEDGNGDAVFNSRAGAEEWAESFADLGFTGIVIPVKELKNDT